VATGTDEWKWFQSDQGVYGSFKGRPAAGKKKDVFVPFRQFEKAGFRPSPRTFFFWKGAKAF